MTDAVYLRDLDGTGSMHVCSQEDPGAREYLPSDARPMTVAEAAKVRETDDEAEVMRRLIEGERIFYSQDGKVAWLSDADRAHVSYRVVWALRNQGYLKRVSSGEGRVFCDEASDSLRALSQGGE